MAGKKVMAGKNGVIDLKYIIIIILILAFAIFIFLSLNKSFTSIFRL